MKKNDDETIENGKLLSIMATGIRDGERIIASDRGKVVAGTVIQIKGEYPAWIDTIKKLTVEDEKDKFLDRIHELRFFKDMTLKEIKAYMKKHTTNISKLYISHPNMKIQMKFLSIGGTVFKQRLTESQKTELLKGDYIDIHKVYDMLTAPGAKSNLVFRPSNWCVQPASDDMIKFNGTIIGIDGTLRKYKGILDNERYSIVKWENINNDDIAIGIDDWTEPFTNQEIDILIEEEGDVDVKKLLEYWATPSVYKSLLQKMIRTRCKECNFLNSKYDGVKVLVTAFLLLIKHSGAFNPNVSAFERGLQAALKRSAITIVEDSTVENVNDLLSLFASAYYAKHFSTWRPTLEKVIGWVDLIKSSYQRTDRYKWKTIDFAELEHDIKDPYYLCYGVLRSTRSMKGDEHMMSYFAKYKKMIPGKDLHINVPIVHLIDQHVYTSVAWFMDYRPDIPYTKLFNMIWDKCSKYNGRDGKELIEDDFIVELRHAQYQTWFRKSAKKVEREYTNETIATEYKLDDSWLSGLVSVCTETINKKKYAVMLDPNDIRSIKVIPMPSRDKETKAKHLLISDNERERVTDKFLETLEEGINITPPKTLVNIYPKIVIKLVKGEYKVNGIRWSKFRTIKRTINIHDKEDLYPVIYTGESIERDYSKSIILLLQAMDDMSRARLIVYLTSIRGSIEIYPISRNGTSEEYSVAPQDTAVHHFLYSLCNIVPVAIEISSMGFNIKDGPIMWNLKELILDWIIKQDPVIEDVSWNKPKKLRLILFQHQMDAIKKMETGYKHIIYITPGMGKTLIVIEHINWLIKQNRMPLWCVYTLPLEGFKSVIKQFKKRGFTINVLDMTQKGQNKKIRKHCINFIKHDHVRLGDFMESISSKTNNLMFIADEFHKCLRDSIRTTRIISIASLAKHTIAMTGTLINGEDIVSLINWLGLVTKFEVTEKNYWVAIGGLISSHVQTDIKVINKTEELFLTDEEKQLHKKSFQDAVNVCYKVIHKGLVNKTLEYVNKDIGVFLVAKDKKTQETLAEDLKARGINRLYVIGKDAPIDYKPDDKRKLQVIITTPQYSTGYNVTGMFTMVTSVYFSNEFTREQLNARLNRIGQPNKYVEIVTLHCGLLTFVLEKYNHIHSISEATKYLGDVIDLK